MAVFISKKKNLETRFGLMFPQPSPNHLILDLSKIKAVGEDKLNVAQMARFIFERMKNNRLKGKMKVTSIFSFSGSVFRGFFFLVV